MGPSPSPFPLEKRSLNGGLRPDGFLRHESAILSVCQLPASSCCSWSQHLVSEFMGLSCGRQSRLGLGSICTLFLAS